MRQSTFDTTSIQRDITQAEKPGLKSQGGNVFLDLSQRLDSFRSTHPYKEIQVEGRRWRYVVGGQGDRTLLLLPGGTLVPDTYFILLEALEHDYRVIVPAYAPVPTMAETAVRHFVSRAPLNLLARLMKLLPVGAVRFFMWRLWSKLVTTSPEQQAFWLGLLKEILTTQLSKDNLVSVTEEIYDFAAHYHFSSGDLAAWPGKILILQSDQDEAYSPAIRAETRAVYPQALVHTFHNAGHTAIMTATDEFISTIREFLDQG